MLYIHHWSSWGVRSRESARFHGCCVAEDGCISTFLQQGNLLEEMYEASIGARRNFQEPGNRGRVRDRPTEPQSTHAISWWCCWWWWWWWWWYLIITFIIVIMIIPVVIITIRIIVMIIMWWCQWWCFRLHTSAPRQRRLAKSDGKAEKQQKLEKRCPEMRKCHETNHL